MAHLNWIGYSTLFHSDVVEQCQYLRHIIRSVFSPKLKQVETCSASTREQVGPGSPSPHVGTSPLGSVPTAASLVLNVTLFFPLWCTEVHHYQTLILCLLYAECEDFDIKNPMLLVYRSFQCAADQLPSLPGPPLPPSHAARDCFLPHSSLISSPDFYSLGPSVSECARMAFEGWRRRPAEGIRGEVLLRTEGSSSQLCFYTPGVACRAHKDNAT